MLATLGFLITAALLVIFAYTFDNLVKKDNRELRPFGLAYLLVAVSFLMWGVLSLVDASNGTLAKSVMIGDALLLSASICSVLVFISSRRQVGVTAVLGVVSATLLVVRANNYYPEPFIKDGILHFNIQHNVAVLLSVIIVAAWLPACMQAARVISVKHGLARFYTLFMSAYALAIISAALFIQARRRTIIIESFIAFSVSVLLLLISNLLAKNSKGKKVSYAAK